MILEEKFEAKQQVPQCEIESERKGDEKGGHNSNSHVAKSLNPTDKSSSGSSDSRASKKKKRDKAVIINNSGGGQRTEGPANRYPTPEDSGVAVPWKIDKGKK